ncbi:MAG TPA: hypothetical protein VJN01_00475, partial [Xanthomonadales bacterium]|nr:hypothetical protein [Xanthomonadales bacterium]
MTFSLTRYLATPAVLLCLALLPACKPSTPAAAPENSAEAPEVTLPSGAWTAFIDEQIEAYLAAHPAWAVV